MQRSIIHIGMARAASTFMQREVFPRIADFQYFGVESTQFSPAFQKLLYLDDTLFDPEEFARCEASMSSGNKLLSNELFTGQSLYWTSGNRSRTAHRLHAAFPDAEIVLFVRNQTALLESLYALSVYAGHVHTPEAFVRFHDVATSPEHPLIPTFESVESTLSFLYTPLVALYKSLFSKVHVFLYEDFATAPRQGVASLLSVMSLDLDGNIDYDVKPNHSLSSPQIAYLRRVNRLKPLIGGSPPGNAVFRHKVRLIEHGPFGGKRFRFTRELSARIRACFREDNRALLALCPELDGERFEENYLL